MEIKFRCWDGKQMHYADGMDGEVGNFLVIDGEGWSLHRSLELKKSLVTDFRGLGGTPKGFIMQFTGCKDKNNKDIYEGDLLLDEEDGTYNSVEWDKNYGGWATSSWFSVGDFGHITKSLEVVGNIYENQGLIEK